MSQARAQPGKEDLRWLTPRADSFETVNGLVCAPLLDRRERTWRMWWIAFLTAGALTSVMGIAIGWLLWKGVGVWGINTSVVWGYAIANYVWWIGIGNAGTLISALLLITRQRWRASINRFAEAMTLFAAAIAGLFPILHLGRPMYFYFLAPYPNTMALWPQWRSALIWDFWAILSYILFSIIFWYIGLIPDLATLRDRARNVTVRKIYGAFALGWRGSARHWRIYTTYQVTMACLAVPLVVSLHSVVGLDFAASLMVGWNETIFPPYFVVGAMYSGFAMVVVLAAAIRWGLSLQSIITIQHFEVMAKIMLAASLIMGLSYATEWFGGWYTGDQLERGFVAFEFTGRYAVLFWLLLFFNCVLPQAFWLPAIRRSIWAVIIIAVGINVGMWLERICIVLNTLSHHYEPSEWGAFAPTLWDWLLLAGSLGFFALMYLIFVRLLPAVSMHEVRHLVHQEVRA
jgi:molybdopterin-containing oxidoreductase family membrane subunit